LVRVQNDGAVTLMPASVRGVAVALTAYAYVAYS
jgi:hypothetical protein